MCNVRSTSHLIAGVLIGALVLSFGSSISTAQSCGSDVDFGFEGSNYADSSGQATKQFTVPSNFDLGEVHVQAAELENTSAIIRRVIIEQ